MCAVGSEVQPRLVTEQSMATGLWFKWSYVYCGGEATEKLSSIKSFENHFKINDSNLWREKWEFSLRV